MRTDKHIIASANFASDQAKPCICGSTIAAYQLAREPDCTRRIDVQCCSCFRRTYFFPVETPSSAAACSSAHRLD